MSPVDQNPVSALYVRSFLDSLADAPVGAVLLDVSGRWIRGANREAEYMLRRGLNGLDGALVTDFVDADACPDAAAAFARVMETGRSEKIVVAVHASVHHHPWVTVRLARLQAGDCRVGALAYVSAVDADSFGSEPLHVRVARMESRLTALEATNPVDEPVREDGLATLSTREREVLALFARGNRVPTIAKEMYLSASTVRNHLSMIFKKLGVTSQTELAERFRGVAIEAPVIDIRRHTPVRSRPPAAPRIASDARP